MRSRFLIFIRALSGFKNLPLKTPVATLSLNLAAARARPGHRGHETGDICWRSRPVPGFAFAVLLTASLFNSSWTPRILAGAFAAIVTVIPILMR